MNELIKLVPTNLNGEKIQAVDARELHEFLESKQDFSTWIKNRIQTYKFRKGSDFEVFHNFVENSSGGRPPEEYYVTIDMAKELSMVERNERGKQARQYFIECERRAREISAPTTAEQLLSTARVMVDIERKQWKIEKNQAEHERRLEILEARINSDGRTGGYYNTITGYAKTIGVPVGNGDAQRFGAMAAQLSRKAGTPIHKVRHKRSGLINSYHETILRRVFGKKPSAPGFKRRPGNKKSCLNAKVDATLKQRMKVHCADRGITIQSFLDDAIFRHINNTM